MYDLGVVLDNFLIGEVYHAEKLEYMSAICLNGFKDENFPIISKDKPIFFDNLRNYIALSCCLISIFLKKPVIIIPMIFACLCYSSALISFIQLTINYN